VIVAQTLTDQDTDDPSQVAPLLDQIDDPIGRVTADGVYDGVPTYQTIAADGDGIEVVIPPRSTAVPSGDPGVPTPRDRHLAMIAEQGRLSWQAATDYGQRSFVETTMDRYKALIGPRLRARGFAAQQTEAAIGGAVLNRMLAAGRPDSVRRQPIIASQSGVWGHLALDLSSAPTPLQSRRHPTDDPTVVYYEGFHKIPSRCHVVHRRDGDRVLFALGHIQYGGTSPTNMIEELATEMWKRFYPKDRFDRIEWFDAWPESYSLSNQFHIQRVRFPDGKQGGGPMWLPAGDLPADFVDEVRRVITPDTSMQAAAE